VRQPGDFFSEIQGLLDNKLCPYFEAGNLATITSLAIIYFVVGKIGLRALNANHYVTAIWLPAGISLAALLLQGKRVWPGIFLGSFFLSLTLNGSISISMGLASGCALEAVVGAYLVNKYANGINAFFKSRDVLRFVTFGGLVACAVPATAGISILCVCNVASWTDFWTLWFVWWVGDVLGVLFLTPFLVLLLGHGHHFSGLAETLETTVLIAGLSIVCVLNFGPRPVSWIPGNALLFLCAPFLVWSALRFCPLEAAGATLIMGGIATWSSAHGFGPFENSTGLPLFVGVFMAVGAATTLTIAAASAEQKRETRDALGMYCVLRDAKEIEIRVLQDTVDGLQDELARNGLHRTNSSSPKGIH
jgi:integral membrane sensor domain MASE1